MKARENGGVVFLVVGDHLLEKLRHAGEQQVLPAVCSSAAVSLVLGIGIGRFGVDGIESIEVLPVVGVFCPEV